MNNYKPEVNKLQSLYRHSSVKLNIVTVTTHEEKTDVNGTVFDLTQRSGMHTFAASIATDASTISAIESMLASNSTQSRDDLAHLIAVYAATQQDGEDRMSRVVLSGHGAAPAVMSEAKDTIRFVDLVSLARLFPKAAAQTKHLILLSCMSGFQDDIKDFYVPAYPNVQTIWGFRDLCPTGSKAADLLEHWAKLTDLNPTQLPEPEAGQSNWAMNVYQPDDSNDAAKLLTSMQNDEARYQEYFNGTKTDADQHAGWLTDYYIQARHAQHNPGITGKDHDFAFDRAEGAFRLRFWKAMVSQFWKAYHADIIKGYGKASAPNFGVLSRKDALAAIAKFKTIANGDAADLAEAGRLLTGLEQLDNKILSETWIQP